MLGSPTRLIRRAADISKGASARGRPPVGAGPSCATATAASAIRPPRPLVGGLVHLAWRARLAVEGLRDVSCLPVCGQNVVPSGSGGVEPLAQFAPNESG